MSLLNYVQMQAVITCYEILPRDGFHSSCGQRQRCYGAHESRATDHSNIHGAMSKMTHLSSPIHYGDDESLLDFAAGTPMKNDEKLDPRSVLFLLAIG